MYCISCGKVLEENDLFCSYCGMNLTQKSNLEKSSVDLLYNKNKSVKEIINLLSKIFLAVSFCVSFFTLMDSTFSPVSSFALLIIFSFLIFITDNKKSYIFFIYFIISLFILVLCFALMILFILFCILFVGIFDSSLYNFHNIISALFEISALFLKTETFKFLIVFIIYFFVLFIIQHFVNKFKGNNKVENK